MLSPLPRPLAVHIQTMAPLIGLPLLLADECTSIDSLGGGSSNTEETMHQAIRRHLIVTYAISLGLMTIFMSLLQPTPSVSAQQLTGPVSQEISGTDTQGRLIENMASTLPYPTKSLEKKGAQISARKPHRLIRKPQSAPVASVEPTPSGSSPVTSLPTPPPSIQSDNTTSQSKAPSLLSTSVGATMPLATMSVAPSSATATGSTAAGTAPTGAIPLASAGSGNSSTSGNGGAGGRTMRRIAAEMSGLTQLISPPSVPALSVNPAIGASPTSLSFTAQAGANPAAQTLTISNTGGGTLSWSASDSATWLSLSPASGTGTGVVTASVATGTMTTGSYSGTITLSATGAASVTIPVALTITAAPVPPAIGISPTSLSFTAQQGGGNPAPQTLNIRNAGGGTLSWSAGDNAPWASPSPTSGTGNGVVTISVTTGSLAAGTYNGVVTLSAPGATSVTVPVAFTITAAVATVTPSATLAMSPSSLSYAATQGAANPANQNISLTNSGGTLNWTVSDDASWLAVSPASGSGSSTLTTSVNTAGLTAGTYNGTITLSAAGTASKTVAVTLTVSAPATSSATLTWNADTATDLAGYKIYRATTSGGYGAPIATLTGSVTSYIATGLQSGTTYFFVVTAYDSSGNESTRSNEVSKSIF